MIASLEGCIKAVRPHSLILEVAGVGFEVYPPTPLLESVRVGQPLALYTYMHVREGNITLYGFLTLEEHDLFEALLGVNGIGPRTALSVLSMLSPDALRAIIAQGNAAALARIPGLGAKTAQRLILDLKDKIGLPVGAVSLSPLQEADVDVINALTALGYSLAEAQRA
ncbi:MAG: Holliday junction branch migration protein RuvA, partial [Chloroflexi bacterium]|nr:Holliday junction branch migration protein RuvA [Chloroflexota bacterium]